MDFLHIFFYSLDTDAKFKKNNFSNIAALFDCGAIYQCYKKITLYLFSNNVFQQILREKYNGMLDRIEDLADIKDEEAKQ